MKSLAYCFTLLSTLIICAMPQAQAAPRARVFVSVNGVDSGDCRATAPCRTFQFAHDAVLAGGEISVLDTGGYGTLIVNKAVSIVAIGVEASIATASGGAAIIINAASTDAVSLRGLTLDGQGVAANGMVFNSGNSLKIEDCVVRNMTGDGIHFVPSAVSSLSISRTFVGNNGSAGINVHRRKPRTSNVGTLRLPGKSLLRSLSG